MELLRNWIWRFDTLRWKLSFILMNSGSLIGSQCIIIYRITVVLTGNRNNQSCAPVMAAFTAFHSIDGKYFLLWKAIRFPMQTPKIFVVSAHCLWIYKIAGLDHFRTA